MEIPALGSALAAAASPGSTQRNANQALSNLNIDDFFKLLIAELANQDPLNPLENNEILQQVSQIREIGATQKLSDTLDAVLLGQHVASATGLIGKNVTALSNDGQSIVGPVQSVSIAAGDVTLQVGEHEVALNNVREILSPS
jgi:flagellar basal-body rod modification protein FlgD